MSQRDPKFNISKPNSFLSLAVLLSHRMVTSVCNIFFSFLPSIGYLLSSRWIFSVKHVLNSFTSVHLQQRNKIQVISHMTQITKIASRLLYKQPLWPLNMSLIISHSASVHLHCLNMAVASHCSQDKDKRPCHDSNCCMVQFSFTSKSDFISSSPLPFLHQLHWLFSRAQSALLGYMVFANAARTAWDALWSLS